MNDDLTCPLAAAERNDQRTGRALGRLQRQALAETADRHQAATALAGALMGVVGVKIDPGSDELPQEVIMACLDGIAFVGRLGAHGGHHRRLMQSADLGLCSGAH